MSSKEELNITDKQQIKTKLIKKSNSTTRMDEEAHKPNDNQSNLFILELIWGKIKANY
ncbi:hypothetical protein [Limosilactobacillus reuteri]|uniref:hypothetical protein n=1 Tax=Limosilactobacillus reuteri TaxID=1598 RepID=UPI001E3A3496|nr:hypothetical protein [Limosilactobacillus reuteri]MCC4358001.1 hypothetical protein [Limosilactobacillus reuteri]MCC4365159.1 hypothetical protein [Limosilactobacillus reuteri]